MTNSTFSFFSSIFGFVVAVVSLAAFIIKICQSHLPSNKIKILESLLDETETFFTRAVEDGLLTEPNFVHETERHLAILRTRTHVLQSTTYSATSLYRDYSELLYGTSSAIGRTCDSLKKLRAHVVTSSEEGRRGREVNSISHPALPAVLHLDPEYHVTSSPPTNIARPRSCPPVISSGKPDNWQYTTTESNPFHDPMQGDSDLRTADVRTCASPVRTSVPPEHEA